MGCATDGSSSKLLDVQADAAKAKAERDAELYCHQNPQVKSCSDKRENIIRQQIQIDSEQVVIEQVDDEVVIEQVEDLEMPDNVVVAPRVSEPREATLHKFPRIVGNYYALSPSPKYSFEPHCADYRENTHDGNPLGCSIIYKSERMIVPLVEIGVGATYSGSIHYSVFDFGKDKQVNRQANADFHVDFSKNTITYNGSIRNNPEIPITASVEARYNAQGQVTGIATIRGEDSDISGIIGNIELIGYFGNIDKKYVGSFNAHR